MELLQLPRNTNRTKQGSKGFKERSGDQKVRLAVRRQR